MMTASTTRPPADRTTGPMCRDDLPAAPAPPAAEQPSPARERTGQFVRGIRRKSPSAPGTPARAARCASARSLPAGAAPPAAAAAQGRPAESTTPPAGALRAARPEPRRQVGPAAPLAPGPARVPVRRVRFPPAAARAAAEAVAAATQAATTPSAGSAAGPAPMVWVPASRAVSDAARQGSARSSARAIAPRKPSQCRPAGHTHWPAPGAARQSAAAPGPRHARPATPPTAATAAPSAAVPGQHGETPPRRVQRPVSPWAASVTRLLARRRTCGAVLLYRTVCTSFERQATAPPTAVRPVKMNGDDRHVT